MTDGITDAHVHLLPGRLGQAVRAFFDERIPGELAYPNDHPVVLKTLAGHGVTRVWNLPYAHRAGIAEGLNAAVAAITRDLGHLGVEIVPGASVHPGDEEPAAVVGRALDAHGARVVKLHCSVGDFDADDPRLEPMWRLLAGRGVPAVLHAGRDVTGRTAAAELTAVERVARRHPRVAVVIAHAAHPATDRAVDLVRAHDNVYLDLTPRVVDPVDLSQQVLETFCERILYGSDVPNTGVLVEAGLARLGDLSEPARRRITSQTAASLVP